MGAFKKFGPGDQVDNVLILEPEWTLVSGTSGWRGSPEGSASVSLFEGRHRSTPNVTREYRYQRTIPGTDSYGPLVRTGPITASVNFVYMTSDERQILSQRSNQRWGYEHWKTVMGLYDYYERRSPDYVTASYDHYCLFFHSASSNILTMFDRATNDPVSYRGIPTGSYTLEAWFKPFLTGTAGQQFTIMSHAHAYKLYVSGTTGKLAIGIHSGTSDVQADVTSSVGPSVGEWHHVAVTFDHTTLTGTMYLDLQNVATFTRPSGIPVPISYTGSLHIGGEWNGQLVGNDENYSSPGALSTTAFHGLIGDVRVWNASRTYTQISSSHNARLTGSALQHPLAVNAQLREGPLAFASPTVNPAGALITGYAGGGLMGSGALDYAAVAQSSASDFGVMYNFSDRSGPGWHPSDNTRFYVPKQFAPAVMSGSGWGPIRSEDVKRMLVVTIPAGMFGRRIVPNSVRIVDNAFSDDPYGIIRTLVDDGRGGLFISGSVVSSSLNLLGDITVHPSDYNESVKWNKVGNVFYDEGLIVIKDPSLLDLGASWPSHANDDLNILDISFRGDSRIPVKTMMCRIDRGDLNASLNKTFWEEEEDGDRVRRHQSGSLYVTTVGIYNSDRELVGVARLAEPLRVRPRDRMNIKLRIDF